MLPLRARVDRGAMAMKSTPQSSSITGALPLDCLVSYPGHSLGGLTPLHRCSQCILSPNEFDPHLVVYTSVKDMSIF